MNTRKSAAKKWTLIVLVVFVLIAIIGGTYSRYTNTGSGTGTVQVAKWAIKINNTDITSTATFNVSFHDVPNEYVVDNKIAPASQVYADFVIDPTGSEVAVDFEFALGAITSSNGVVPTGLAVTKVCYMNGDTEGDTITADSQTGTYMGTIELASQSTALTNSQAKTVRVYVTWDNGNDSHNSADTTSGVAAPTLSMTVTGTASQHIAN